MLLAVIPGGLFDPSVYTRHLSRTSSGWNAGQCSEFSIVYTTFRHYYRLNIKEGFKARTGSFITCTYMMVL